MTSKAITQVSLVKVGMQGDAPCYKYRDDLPVTGGDHVKAVADYLRSNPTRTPHPHNGRPERFVDVKVKRAVTGNCLFVFELDLVGLNRKKLQFPEAGNKFIFFPTDYGAGTSFLLEKSSYDGGGRAWGAFSCDLDTLRGSALATRVKQFGGQHNHGIRVPFYFNFVDQDLLAPPWIVPDHEVSRVASHHAASGDGDHHPERPHVHPEDPGRRGAGATHGGVHPNSLAFLSVDF
ncbi:MAG TPA: hypothetical protein VEA61_04715 [Allosphingosinicella sp.]|nr:hypothetical protein [Allosphingosinicella sp.]